MIIFYKNYRRLERTYLSIQSVRYLFPNIEIHCLIQYKNEINEINEKHIKLLQDLNIVLHFEKKLYDFGANGCGSTVNGYYFTEYINKIQKLSNNYEKVLILDEDNFFTTGETIHFLLNNEYDFAYGTWIEPDGTKDSVNASIICINSKKLAELFPLPEQNEYIEPLLRRELLDKCVKLRYSTLTIPTRNYDNYGNDGLFTNDVEVIKHELKLKNIVYKDLN
jgi:hypothetical protein